MTDYIALSKAADEIAEKAKDLAAVLAHRAAETADTDGHLGPEKRWGAAELLSGRCQRLAADLAAVVTNARAWEAGLIYTDVYGQVPKEIYELGRAHNVSMSDYEDLIDEHGPRNWVAIAAAIRSRG